MAGLQVPGIGSGLDVNSIVTQLMNVSRQQIAGIDKKVTQIQTQISDFGRMKASFEKLQGVLKNLSSESAKNTLLGIKATSSTPENIGVAADPGATFGTYSVKIDSLAQGQKLSSNSTFSSATADIATTDSTISIVKGTISGGTLNSTTGTYSGSSFATTNTAITVNIKTGDSLNDIRDAINKANAGVKASVIYDGANYRLSMSTTGVGNEESLKITSSGDDSAISNLLDYDVQGTQNFKQVQAAGNMTGSIDGVDVSFKSNTIKDAITGVTLYAYKTGTSTVSVSQDSASINQALGSITSAWNELATLYNASAGFNSATKTAGTLYGDSYLRMSFGQLRQNIFSSTASEGSNVNPQFSSLASIGFNVGKNGLATLDTVKLNKALADNPEAIYNLFSTTQGNVFGNALTTLKSMVDDSGLQTRLDGFNNRIKVLNSQKTALENRLVNEEATLRKRFGNLDVLIANLNNTGSFLTQKFSG